MKSILTKLTTFSGVTSLLSMAVLALDIGIVQLAYEQTKIIQLVYNYIFIYFVIDSSLRLVFAKRKIRHLLTHVLDSLVFLGMGALIITQHSVFPSLLIQLCLVGIIIGRFNHITSLLDILKFKPEQMLLLGFVFFGFIGALCLSLPIAVKQGSIPFIDALFTSISAICVTGLITADVSTTFSVFGQGIILVLIQMGGLGIMVFSALLAIMINRKFSQKKTRELQDTFATENLKESYKLIRFIFQYTIFFEIIGTGLLFLAWRNEFTNIYQNLYHSIFHSISAFCNAGFSLYSDSFARYATNVPVILTISSLIIVGGLGFPVIFNLSNLNVVLKRRYKEIPYTPARLQTKLAITITGWLLVIGTVVILLGEYNGALAGYSIGDKVLMSFFNSVSARTAGFSTVSIATFGQGTLLVIMILMFIGASPGSTGGGIKTSTLGVLIGAFWAKIRSFDSVEMFHRTIPKANILKALSVIVLSFIILNGFFYAMLTTEKSHYFITILFETISAFGTVGLSLGLTEYLSENGKILIIILMLIGRVGPLTIAFALAKPKPKANYAYPEEPVLIA